MSHAPNRFTGFVDENQGALNFEDAEIEKIIKSINEKDFTIPVDEKAKGRKKKQEP